MSTHIPTDFHSFNNFLSRSSTQTDESPFPSGLNTPTDEEFNGALGLLGPYGESETDLENMKTPRCTNVRDGQPPNAKPKSLHKAATKGFSKAISKIWKKGKTGSFIVSNPCNPEPACISRLSSCESQKMPVGSIDDGLAPASKDLYSLPNLPILPGGDGNISETGLNDSCSQELSMNSDSVSNSRATQPVGSLASIDGKDTVEGEQDTSFEDPDMWDDATAYSTCSVDFDSLLHTLQVLTLRSALATASRVSLFLPWCIAVGGAIVLFPDHLETVAFAPGYLESPKGVRRFAHWATCAMQHVMIFLAMISILVWWNVTLGTVLALGVLARSFSVWYDFALDRNVPLGDDDRQTFYLLVTNSAFDSDSTVISRTEKGYVVGEGMDMVLLKPRNSEEDM